MSELLATPTRLVFQAEHKAFETLCMASSPVKPPAMAPIRALSLDSRSRLAHAM